MTERSDYTYTRYTHITPTTFVTSTYSNSSGAKSADKSKTNFTIQHHSSSFLFGEGCQQILHNSKISSNNPSRHCYSNRCRLQSTKLRPKTRVTHWYLQPHKLVVLWRRRNTWVLPRGLKPTRTSKETTKSRQSSSLTSPDYKWTSATLSKTLCGS